MNKNKVLIPILLAVSCFGCGGGTELPDSVAPESKRQHISQHHDYGSDLQREDAVAAIAAAEDCSQDVKDDVTAPAASGEIAYVDCNLTLDSSDIITKRIHLRGAEASGITLDCGGATLDGSAGMPNHGNGGRDMIAVYPQKLGPDEYSVPRHITIRNCVIEGAVRIWGMGANSEEIDVRESSRQQGHIERVRGHAPSNILIEQVKITAQGARTPLYLGPGTTHITLRDSELTGYSVSVGLYFDAESGYHHIHRNYFHVINEQELVWGLYTRRREDIAIDGSEHNLIEYNYFSALEGGGIFIYRNCGAGGTVRWGKPQHNIIIDNEFYYNTYDGERPSIWVGQRVNTSFPYSLPPDGAQTYCGDDRGYEALYLDSSSASDRNYAQSNYIENNIFHRLAPQNMIWVRDDSSNIDNYIGGNHQVYDNRASGQIFASTGREYAPSPYGQKFAEFNPDHIFRSGDFDGDGYLDLIDIDTGAGTATVHLAPTMPFRSNFQYSSSYLSTAAHLLFGDATGDGLDDLIVVRDNNGTAQARVYSSNGSTFLYSKTSNLAGYSPSQHWLVGDVDGDGRDDLINVYGNQGQARAWLHRSLNSVGSFEFRTSFTTLAGFSTAQEWRTGDFNGDGRADLVNIYGHEDIARAWVHASTGDAFEFRTSFTNLDVTMANSGTWVVGDFSGDGLADLMQVYGVSGNNRSWTHFATSDGFEHRSIYQTLSDRWSENMRFIAGDFDRDGIDDVYRIYHGPWLDWLQ